MFNEPLNVLVFILKVAPGVTTTLPSAISTPPERIKERSLTVIVEAGAMPCPAEETSSAPVVLSEKEAENPSIAPVYVVHWYQGDILI